LENQKEIKDTNPFMSQIKLIYAEITVLVLNTKNKANRWFSG